MPNVNDMLSQMARSGQLNIGGFGGGYPIKTLAVIDGKTYEKDYSLLRTDMPFGHLRRFLTSSLPYLEEDANEMYSLSWIADETIAYQTFELRRMTSRWENADDEEVDEMILKGIGCIMRCGNKTKAADLKVCAGCKHVQYCGKACQTKHWSGIEDRGRGKEWSHKKACKKLRGKPLRMNLDEIDDETSDIGVDLTYGFVLIRKVPRAGSVEVD